MRCRETQECVNAEEAAVHEVPSIQLMATVGEEPAPTVDQPELVEV